MTPIQELFSAGFPVVLRPHTMPVDPKFLHEEDVDLMVADCLAKVFIFALSGVGFWSQPLGIG